ncbi:RTA1-domain-containing protein [Trametes coccinea BRFM310]|uniref:RTA1-domain-containing protein n=1 Tax=Trametes coccinea (strain BRFM310) TaxID=1353009 RepID=A0A1Y2ITW8_TRAC3|nr:RTA1-domain-containing protein [Trametes coccinea BRFM310]
MSSTDSSTDNLYGYTPTRGVCFLFVILYSLSTTCHFWQAIRSRAWWLLPTVVLAGIAEVVGWAARTKSSYDPTLRMPFIIQTSILVLAPTPFVAALFVGFGRIAARLGAQYSRLSPKLYSRIFLTADILSLLIQGGGGGIAAANTNDPDKARLGSDIILGGLIIQIISMSIFCFFMADYAYRRAKDRPFRAPEPVSYAEAGLPSGRHVMDRKMMMLVAGVIISTALIYIRSVYRIIEFANGFNGSIAHTQILFDLFDGMLVTMAMYTLNIMHPGTLLRATETGAAYALTDRSQVSFDRRTSSKAFLAP